MGSSFQVIAFLLLSNILSITTATRAIEPDSCGPCTKPPVVPVVPLPPVHEPKVPVTPGIVPPITVPKLPVPPVTVTVPPVTVPIVPVLPPVTTIPPVTVPGVVPLPPVTVPTVPIVGVLPPVTVPTVPIVGVLPLPPLSVPPVVGTTPKKGKPCAPPAQKKATCPMNTLKLGACASVLGGTVSVGMGDPAVNKCCPIISGLGDAEAAACLCTTLKINTLNLKMNVPVALQLLVTCGKTPPPGFTCAV